MEYVLTEPRNNKTTRLLLNALLTIFFFLLCPGLIEASELVPPANGFRTMNITHGLSHNMINCIFKDARGFVWLGTQTGLNRFDGINLKTYPAFNARTIFDVCETDSVDLWVGTDKGLMRLNRKSGVVESIALEAASVTVKSLLVTNENRLLIATNRGLFMLHNTLVSKELLDLNVLSQTNSLTKIIKGDEPSSYWITSNNGIIHYNTLTKRSFVYKHAADNSLLNNYSCLLLKGDNLYLGTKSSGLVRFNIPTHQFTSLPDIGCAYITTLALADDTHLYVGTNGGGVKVVSLADGKVLSSIEHTEAAGSISSNAVYSFLREGDITWIGTYMGGLNYTPTQGTVFSVYSSPMFNSAHHNVRSFWVGDEGCKVIGTRDGFYLISEKEKQVRRYSSKNSLLRSDIILSVYPFRNEYLIGTYGGGLYRLNPVTGDLSFFKDDDAFKTGSFPTFVQDKQGNLWMATSKGAYVYHPQTGKYTLYNNRNSALSINSIFAMYVDSKNRIWLGTAGAVYMYDSTTGTFHSDMFPEEVKAVTRSVRFIYEDSRQTLWFCDDKEGVITVDESFTKFDYLTTDDFLPNNSIMSILEDSQQGMWFSSQRGLLYHSENGDKYFSLYDGIPSYIFNYPVQRDSRGTIWWGNEQGLVAFSGFEQQSEGEEKRRTAPVITDVTVAGKTLSAGDDGMPCAAEFLREITLPASANKIEFTFSALNYPVEHSEMYEFCLEGYDKGWERLVDNNKVSYTNLPAGEYVFKVKHASHPEQVLMVNVKVTRNIPFMGWFIALCVVVCCLLIGLYSRLWRKYQRMQSNVGSNSDEKAPLQSVKEKYAKSKIESYEVQTIQRNLLEYVQQEKPYLNSDLKLSELAKAVGCTAGELSQVLNQYLNTNFPDFINNYRVEEFIIRVQDKSAVKYTLTSLSEQCGFSSRTSFFRSFKKLKGKSPAEFIRDSGVFLDQ